MAPKPKYKLWEGLHLAVALALRAIDEIRELARLPGPKGEQGERGADGMGFDDLEFSFDGERTLTARFRRGEDVKEIHIRFPNVLDAGVYREGPDYVRGDGVTYAGCFWIAQKDLPQGKPDSGNGDWRLAVKKGRDGKDADSPKRGGGGGDVSVSGR